MKRKKPYIDLFIADIQFDDIADLFFTTLFYWIAWNISLEMTGSGIYGIVSLTAIFLMRLRK